MIYNKKYREFLYTASANGTNTASGGNPGVSSDQARVSEGIPSRVTGQWSLEITSCFYNLTASVVNFVDAGESGGAH